MKDVDLYAKSLVQSRVLHAAASVEQQQNNLRYIRSIGTERNYRGCIREYLRWRLHQRLDMRGPHWRVELEAYLQDQAEVLSQKALDQHRQALQIVFAVQLKNYLSIRVSTLRGKDLTPDQVAKLLSVQSERVALSTLICLDGGLRASELLTLQPIAQQARSPQRSWRDDLFSHRSPSRTYSVWGKGGLRRVVALALPIADRLDQLRLEEAIQVIDREIYRRVHYNLIGGQSFSQSFSASATKALGVSVGAHALRHCWAKNRYAQLIRAGKASKDALEIVSQESGHFRPSITLTYLHA
jgi:integrase